MTGPSVAPEPEASAAPLARWRDEHEALRDRIREALAKAGTELDEADTEYVVEAVFPLILTHGTARHDAGVEYGYWSAKQAVARRLGLGDLVPPTTHAGASESQTSAQASADEASR